MKARFIWRALKARYRDQAAELRAIRRWVRPEDTVCDIGANKGSYLYWLSRWVPRGRVVAFEPQERLAHYLRQACDAVSLENVTVEASAVGANSGHMKLFVPGGGDSPGASLSRAVATRERCREVLVPVVALDDYFDESASVRLLKVDAEGGEQGVIAGATRILTRQSPLVLLECENRHLESGSVADVFRSLSDLGYEGRFVYRGSLRALHEFDSSIHQRQSAGRFCDAPEYCNNFVFSKG